MWEEEGRGEGNGMSRSMKGSGKVADIMVFFFQAEDGIRDKGM